MLVAALLVVAAGALGALWAPSGSSVSLRAERIGVDQGWAFALFNLGWAGGVAIGAGAGGALGQLAGDGLPYALLRRAARADRACGRALVRGRARCRDRACVSGPAALAGPRAGACRSGPGRSLRCTP